MKIVTKEQICVDLFFLGKIPFVSLKGVNSATRQHSQPAHRQAVGHLLCSSSCVAGRAVEGLQSFRVAEPLRTLLLLTLLLLLRQRLLQRH